MANTIFFDRKHNVVKVKMEQSIEDFENFEQIIDVINNLSSAELESGNLSAETLAKIKGSRLAELLC
ncbi:MULTISPECIES: hypothetical protein [Pasteurellaceae]|uniref:hypothetical protein n=1 Tax=Pasteurellaceae TaxID=712 RepID=UPI001E43CCB9|nr:MULTISPECIES: hypothetical protein [Pasteurellaceae]MDX3904008.1 hypothetical protein [Pasteurella multocida]MDX3983561.1 hypothetical protein [Pasteurella multocida]HDL1114036.1 hypothetical protein [Mannheimia haemolytica]HDL1115384.1 hypothetical protein [Mannheimia haemolytica]HDL1116644.1 hypothetical protein [Mannheimia haemolytica]